MNKAEERALEIFPSTEKEWKSEFGTFHFDDTNVEHREGFIVGYEQAEKDLALTWEDIRTITKILEEITGEDILVELYNGDPISGYKEVLRRFNRQRNEEVHS